MAKKAETRYVHSRDRLRALAVGTMPDAEARRLTNTQDSKGLLPQETAPLETLMLAEEIKDGIESLKPSEKEHAEMRKLLDLVQTLVESVAAMMSRQDQHTTALEATTRMISALTAAMAEQVKETARLRESMRQQTLVVQQVLGHA